MKHFLNSKVRIVLLLALVLVVACALLSSLTDFDLPQKAVQGVLAPVRAGFQSLTRQAEQYYNYMFRYEALEAENVELKERIAQMEDDARTADALLRENERLRAVNDMLATRTDFELVDAYVISWDSTDWTSSFTINRGSSYGIEAGMCVVTADQAVVGLVTEVGANNAEVKTILDSSLEISSTIATSGHNGMVQGGYAIGEEGMLHMDYLPGDAIIRNNDQVVTSGSTMYPRDLILGYVVDAGFDETGVTKYAILEPAADFDTLEQVFVVTQFETE